MPSALDMTSFDAGLKEYYTPDNVANLTYDKNPFYALVPKDQSFYGRRMPIPTIFGNPQGRSATFSRAQARSTSSKTQLDDFLLTRIKDYGVVTIDNETMEASENDKGAWMNARTMEIDGIMRSLTNSLSSSLFRSGYGAIGQIGSISTTAVTLLNAEDVVQFEVGMELDLSASEAANTLRAYGSSNNGLIVTKVDRDAGTVTFGFNVTDATNGIPTAAASDYIFVRGDRQNSATPSRLKISGLEAWIPFTAPTAGDNFFGFDRSVDPVRLSGLRYDASALPIEEALIKGTTRAGREGVAIDHYLISFTKYNELITSLGSKVQYVDLKSDANVGFRGVRIQGDQGEVKVVPDRNCPTNRVWGLTLNTWTLYSLKQCVRILQSDGNKMLRQSSDDGVEVRVGYYANLGCRAPGENIVLKV